MNPTFQDALLRSLIVVAGVLAAILLARDGHAPALPAIAVGGALGACLVGRFGTSEE